MIRRLLALALILIIGVCSGCSATSQSGPSPTPTTWDPDAYRSPIKLTTPVLSDAERDRLRAEWLAQAAAGSHLKDVPPTPPVERWLFPEETTPYWVRCLNDAGWPAVRDDNGSVYSGELPPAQRPAYDRAFYLCMARFSVDPRTQLPPTKDQLTANWYYFRDYGIPCLQGHGVKPNPLPTLDSYLASNGMNYWMYPKPPPAVPPEVERVCPQNLSSRQLLGLPPEP